MRHVFVILFLLLLASSCGHAPSFQECKSTFNNASSFVTSSTTQAQVESKMGATTAQACDKLNQEGQQPPLPCQANSTEITYIMYVVPGDGSTYCGTMTYILTSGVVTDMVEYERYNDGTWATVAPSP